MQHVLVSEVMTPDPRSLEPGTPMSQVVAAMSGDRLSCVAVCQESRPVGIISERDVVRAYAEKRLEGARAADLMTSPVVSVTGAHSVVEASALLRERRIRRLVVVDDAGLLAGIVTQTDLLSAYTTGLEQHSRELEQRVEERTRSLRELAGRFEALSLEDPLLGIGNRRSMEIALDRQHELARRHGRVYGVALVDVDHFKAYNDGYGHAAGDQALAQVAGCLRSLMRASDSVYRYGGEEMLVLLPETDLPGARVAAERLCGAISGLGLPHEGSSHSVVTVSLGVSVAKVGGRDADLRWSGVVERADAALYRAKESGRNRSEAA